MDKLPLSLDLKAKSCLLVGAGGIAERKARLLLRAGADLTVVAPVANDYFESLGEKQVTLIRGAFEPHMCRGRHLIVAATNSETVNRQVSSAAEQLGVWCNVVDRPELSSVFFPAIIDRSPVTIAIGTAGQSPTLARWLKRSIEARLPTRLNTLASALGRWRDEVRHKITNPDERRGFFDKLLSGPIAGHLLAGRETAAEEAFRRQLDAPTYRAHNAGEAFLVGAGPGDVGLLTLRGHQLLSQADVVLYDALVSEEMLDFARRDAMRVCVGKRAGESHKQAEITQTLVGLVKKGYRVCRLKGGDPLIFGRGGEEAEALARAGLAFEIVPGISAAQGCAASAGIPLTFRRIASSVTLATGVIDKHTDPDWKALARPGQTLALYMSMGSIERVCERLMGAGLPASTPAAVVEKGTTAQERIFDATLKDIARTCRQARVGSPAMLFVGESVALRLDQTKQTKWNSQDVLLFPRVMSA